MINQLNSFLKANQQIVDATEKYIAQLKGIQMSYMSDIDIERQNQINPADEPVNTAGELCMTLDTTREIQAIRRYKDVLISLDDDACLSEDGELSRAEAQEKELGLMKEREAIVKFLGYRLKNPSACDEHLEKFKGHPEYEKDTPLTAWDSPWT
jgi:hypothetical protein